MNREIPKPLPPNWHVLQDDDPQVIEFGERKKTRIYVNHYLGVEALSSQLGAQGLDAEVRELLDRIRGRLGPDLSAKLEAEFAAEFRIRAAFPKVLPYQLVERIRDRLGDIHYVLFGHSHHQFFHVNNDVALINPGAFGMGFKAYKRSYAVIDTKSWDVVFGRAAPPAGG
jgi:hypothetical protein